MTVDEETVVVSQLAGKLSKAHERAVVTLQFIVNGDDVLLCSVGHDCLKLWTLSEDFENAAVCFSQSEMFKLWRCGVQSAHIFADGSGFGIVGLDSMLYTLGRDDDGNAMVMNHDVGFMQTWHVAGTRNQSFITMSFSGHISEIIEGKVANQEPYSKAKNIISTALSPSTFLLALSNHEGAVDIVDTRTLKSDITFEAHAMRVRAMLFLSEEFVLTGCDDKTVKLHKIIASTAVCDRTFCGQRAGVTALAAAPDVLSSRRFASASNQGHVVLWSLDQTSPQAVLPSPHEGAINSMSWSPCGQYLVAGGEDKQLSAYRVAAAPFHAHVPLLGGRHPQEEAEPDALPESQPQFYIGSGEGSQQNSMDVYGEERVKEGGEEDGVATEEDAGNDLSMNVDQRVQDLFGEEENEAEEGGREDNEEPSFDDDTEPVAQSLSYDQLESAPRVEYSQYAPSQEEETEGGYEPAASSYSPRDL